MTPPTSARRSSTRTFWLGAAASLMFAASLVTMTARVHERAEAQEQDLTASGREITETACTSCHGMEEVTALRRTPGDWNDTVVAMAARGADATDDQLAVIKRYLTRYYGIAAVNTATSQDLSAVLGLTAKDAEAIVAYRKTNGKFSSLDALLKVPGIDASKLEVQPDALSFE